MSRKTESLLFPKNPLAAMRELQNLDAGPSPAEPPEPTEERDHATSLPVACATGSEVSSVTTLAERSQAGSEVAKFPTARRPRREAASTAEPVDSITDAVKELLSRPYTNGAKKGPLTVSTVKMPSEVSERLGWASKLSGQTKQDIIADALKDYFQKMLRQL